MQTISEKKIIHVDLALFEEMRAAIQRLIEIKRNDKERDGFVALHERSKNAVRMSDLMAFEMPSERPSSCCSWGPRETPLD